MPPRSQRLVGLTLGFRDWRRFGPLVAIVMYLTVMLSLVHGLDPYGLAIMHAVLILGAFTVVEGMQWIRSLLPPGQKPQSAG